MAIYRQPLDRTNSEADEPPACTAFVVVPDVCPFRLAMGARYCTQIKLSCLNSCDFGNAAFFCGKVVGSIIEHKFTLPDMRKQFDERNRPGIVETC